MTIGTDGNGPPPACHGSRSAGEGAGAYSTAAGCARIPTLGESWRQRMLEPNTPITGRTALFVDIEVLDHEVGAWADMDRLRPGAVRGHEPSRATRYRRGLRRRAGSRPQHRGSRRSRSDRARLARLTGIRDLGRPTWVNNLPSRATPAVSRWSQRQHSGREWLRVDLSEPRLPGAGRGGARGRGSGGGGCAGGPRASDCPAGRALRRWRGGARIVGERAHADRALVCAELLETSRLAAEAAARSARLAASL